MAMALSDGVNPAGENRRKILRRFLARKNKKGAIKGTTDGDVKEFKLTLLTVSVLSFFTSVASIGYLFFCSLVY